MSENKAGGLQDETLSNETLMKLLKEKSKEFTKSQKVQKKLEEGYVKVTKEKQKLVKDRETFV